MMGGAFLMRERVMLTVDEAEALPVAKAATGRVWARMLDANSGLQAPAGFRPGDAA